MVSLVISNLRLELGISIACPSTTFLDYIIHSTCNMHIL